MAAKDFFAVKLRQLREAEGLTQAKFAEELGVSRGSISFYENGDRVPDIDFLEKVAARQDCTTDYLLGTSEFKNHDTQIKAEGKIQEFLDEIKSNQGYLTLIDTLTRISKNIKMFNTEKPFSAFMVLLLNIDLLLDKASKATQTIDSGKQLNSEDFAKFLLELVNYRELVDDRVSLLWSSTLFPIRDALQAGGLVQETELLNLFLKSRADIDGEPTDVENLVSQFLH